MSFGTWFFTFLRLHGLLRGQKCNFWTNGWISMFEVSFWGSFLRPIQWWYNIRKIVYFTKALSILKGHWNNFSTNIKILTFEGSFSSSNQTITNHTKPYQTIPNHTNNWKFWVRVNKLFLSVTQNIFPTLYFAQSLKCRTGKWFWVAYALVPQNCCF